MKAITPRSEWEYIPKCDRNLKPEEQSVCILRPLTPEQKAFLDDNASEIVDGKYRTRTGTQNFLLLNFGLVRINNFKNAQDQEVKTERDEKRVLCGVHPLTDAFLSAIPDEIMYEIATEIYMGSKVGETDKKN